MKLHPTLRYGHACCYLVITKPNLITQAFGRKKSLEMRLNMEAMFMLLPCLFQLLITLKLFQIIAIVRHT